MLWKIWERCWCWLEEYTEKVNKKKHEKGLEMSITENFSISCRAVKIQNWSVPICVLVIQHICLEILDLCSFLLLPLLCSVVTGQVL